MPKIGRTLSYINTERKGKGTEQSPVSQSLGSSRPGGSVSMPQGDYLLKSIWDKVFEIRTDSQGTEYIFGKLPVVTQYGITMYSGDGVNVPSLASGLPFDGRTIWYNPDTQQIEVIGGTGGGSGEGVSNFWDLSGIPPWITNSKPKYTYSEIEGTPDLTKYALASQIPSLSGYATESWVLQKNYATKATTLSGYGITDAYTKTNVDDLLKAYVTLGGTQTITGEKNFTGGLKVNGSPIYYDTEKKYWKLEGDLLVTGGVTMYGNEGTYTPSTIMDAILYDDTTLGINSNGQLYVKGGAGGGINTTDLQNYLTQNLYLNVTSGDNRYLKLSGGTIQDGSNRDLLTLNTTNISGPLLKLSVSNTIRALLGVASSTNYGAFWTYADGNIALLLGYDGKPYFSTDIDNFRTKYELLHSNNFSSYALPLSGGIIDNNSTTNGVPLVLNTNYLTETALQISNNSVVKSVFGWYNGDSKYGTYMYSVSSRKYLGIKDDGTPHYHGNTLWHSGNFNPSNYLSLSGGEISSTSATPLTINTSNQTIELRLKRNSSIKAYIGWNVTDGVFLQEGESTAYIGVQPNKTPYYFNGTRYTLWHSGNDGSGSGLDADLLDGKQPSELNVASATYSQNTSKLYSTDNIYSYGSANPYYGYLTFNNTYGEWDFKVSPSTPEYIHVYSSDKLRTARTIWGQSFDGTGNVSGSIQLDDGELLMTSSNHWGASAWRLFSYGPTLQILYGDGYSTASNTSAKFNNDGSINVNKLITYEGINNRYSIFDANGLSCYTTSTGGYAVGLGIHAYDGSFSYPIINAYGTGSTLNYIFIGGAYNNPWAKIDTSANMLVKGGITMYSDQRKKTILNHVELSLKQIANAPLIEHYYNSDDKKTTHVGSIAQYWASMNDWFCKLDNEGYYTMEIQNAALASAISIARELDRYETKTDKAIKKLKKRICELEEEVERLRAS